MKNASGAFGSGGSLELCFGGRKPCQIAFQILAGETSTPRGRFVPIVGKTIAPHLTDTQLEITGTFMLGHVRAAALFVANQRMSPTP